MGVAMHRLSISLVSVAALGGLLSAFSAVSSESVATAKPVLEMDWGNLADPGNSGGFGMRVTLLTDGQLSCQYSFLEPYMGFSGSTSSVGKVGSRRMRLLERVFTDAQYLALPSTMPNGTRDAARSQAQLKTSFGGHEKATRLTPGEIEVPADHDLLMKAVDAVFDACPTRPLTPISD
jgi:hypothetical protein